VIPQDDAARDPAAVAQIDRVAGATDPGPGRLIRRAAAEIVIEDEAIFAAIVAALPVMGCLHGADHPARAAIGRATAAAARVSIRGAKRGANAGRRQATPGDNQPWLVQLVCPSGHVQQRAATRRMRPKSGRPAVRPRP